METLEEQGELLDRLFTAVRELDPSSATQIMNLTQSQAPLSEVTTHVDDLLERGAIEKPEEVMEVCNDVQRVQESDKKAQSHEVTKNNDFVSYLLSFRFTWSHPYMNSIDQDLFLQDKRSGELDAPFFPPFPVTTVPADGCVSCSRPHIQYLQDMQ